MTSLSTVRDAALIAASAAVTVFAAGEFVDTVVIRLRRRSAPGSNPLALSAPNGWLSQVGGGVGAMGNPQRPATAEEASAAARAAEIDGGDGVFARNYQDGAIVLPDDPAYPRMHSFYVVTAST